MEITASALDRVDCRDVHLIRATARAMRRPPRRRVRTPEYRALDQIVAEAMAAGNAPVAIGPSGILEIASTSGDPRWQRGGFRCTEIVSHRRCHIDAGPA